MCVGECDSRDCECDALVGEYECDSLVGDHEARGGERDVTKARIGECDVTRCGSRGV